jgi:hypothetical protein
MHAVGGVLIPPHEDRVPCRPCRRGTGSDTVLLHTGSVGLLLDWQVVNVLLSVRRDAAARRFVTRALRTLKVTPSVAVTDAAPAYPGIADHGARRGHRPLRDPGVPESAGHPAAGQPSGGGGVDGVGPGSAAQYRPPALAASGGAAGTDSAAEADEAPADVAVGPPALSAALPHAVRPMPARQIAPSLIAARLIGAWRAGANASE